MESPWELAKARFLASLEPNSNEQELFENATLENIYYTTSNANRDDAENSKARIVVRQLGPLVSAVESFGSALDTFAQIAPLYLSPIWGCIRVILVVARTYAKFYGRFVEILGRIGDILPRFRDYERIFDRQKHQRLTQALSNTYLDIIVLCTQFRNLMREQKASSVRRIFKPASLSLDRQLAEVVERFRHHKLDVEEEARTCHMIEAAEERNTQLVLLAAERRRKLLLRLSAVDFIYKHRKLSESRHAGSGGWLLLNQQYQQWESLEEKNSVLCCYGIPGCGKSVLASTVIDTISLSRSLVFYYCDYADKRSLEPANVFGTLARQCLGKFAMIPESLASDIETVDHDGERITDHSRALHILRQSIDLSHDPLYIILDGLDEASEGNQAVICRGLSKLLHHSSLPIKLLVTGREELRSSLNVNADVHFSSVLMSPSTIAMDIDSYVRTSTRRRILDGSLSIRDPSLEETIASELTKGAHGMFLWVEFQLHDLCEPESDHGIRQVLLNLPRSLSETYDRLLGKIEGAERRDMIERMFKWILCARQPLHVDELREGLAFKLSDQHWDLDKIPTNFDRLVRACGNLVIIDPKSQVVHLAHFTVQQYLLQSDESRFRFTMKEANIMAADFCIAYLCFSDFET